MKHEYRWSVALVLLAALQVAGCSKVVSTPVEEAAGPAKVEHLEGDEPARVTLTEDAVRRLDIQTATVHDAMIGGALRQVIPYAAVLYDTEGDTWTYTNPSAGVFVRHHISVDRVEGDQAVLSSGMQSGTAVVVVGAAELYGSENEFEEE